MSLYKRRLFIAAIGSGFVSGCVGSPTQSPEEEVAELINSNLDGSYDLATDWLGNAFERYDSNIWVSSKEAADLASAEYKDILVKIDKEKNDAGDRKRELLTMFENHVGFAEQAASHLSTAANQQMNGKEGRADMNYQYALEKNETAKEYNQELRRELQNSN
jgi:hypothetical protein